MTHDSAHHPGRWWHALPDGRIQCDLCPRDCRLHEGQRGACFVRQREGDAMVLTTYGRSSGFCIDPIEKKPLNHFLPGTPVLSCALEGQALEQAWNGPVVSLPLVVRWSRVKRQEPSSSTSVVRWD